MRPQNQTTGPDISAARQADLPAIQKRDFRTTKPDLSSRHWVRKDAFATALFNAFSAVFPHGEAFMARSVRAWVNHLPEGLADDARNFVWQESSHAREHGQMNDVLIDAGYDIEPLEKTIKTFVGLFGGRSKMTCLGATMCIEHFTSIIAAEILRNDHHLAGAEPELHELWVWHAIEEIEHKAVAFDVWNYAARDWSAARRYAVRTSLLMAVTISFLINRTRGQMQLLKQDGIAAGPAFRGLIKHGFGRGGLARGIYKPWLSFFRPGFHPWHHDDRTELAKGEIILAQMKLAKTEKARTARAKTVMAEMEPAERRTLPRLANAA